MKSNMATLKSDKKKRCKCSVKGKESDLFAVFFFFVLFFLFGDNIWLQ